MGSKNNPKSRNEDIVIQELEDELLIYDLKTSKAFCLNQTSALIWKSCNGDNSISDISKKLSKILESNVIDEFVYIALDKFQKENLLSNEQEIEWKFKDLSRREIIRKVGFASLVALPVISSLVAPTAVSASSFCGCGSPGDCLSKPGCPNLNNCNGAKQCAP